LRFGVGGQHKVMAGEFKGLVVSWIMNRDRSHEKYP